MESSDTKHESKAGSSFRKRRFSATGLAVCSAIQNGRVKPNENDNNDNELDGEGPLAVKQRQLDTDKTENGDTKEFNLVDFSDEILIEIFKNLDSWAVLALMNSSPRFVGLLSDHRFWHNIDLSNGPLPLGMLEDILVRSNDRTHTIKMRGPPSVQHVAGEFKQFTTTLTFIFPKLQNQLQVLELQGVSLDFGYIHIGDFPVALKRFVLKDCSVKVPSEIKSIFHTIDTHLIKLEELGIEDCDWFEPYYIMAISKLPNLRALSLKGCCMLSKFVPYGSMAARFGFHRLEVLDLRHTPINNADLQCFGAVETLRELLLDYRDDILTNFEPLAVRKIIPPPKPSNDSTLRVADSLINARTGLQQNGEIKIRDSPLTENGTAEAANASLPKCDPDKRVDTADDEKPSTSAHAAALGRATERNMEPQIAINALDTDDVPSTSNGIRRTSSRATKELECTQERLQKLLPGKIVNSDSDSDNDTDTDNKKLHAMLRSLQERNGKVLKNLRGTSDLPFGNKPMSGNTYSSDSDEDDRNDGNDDSNDDDNDDDDDDDDNDNDKNIFEKIKRKQNAGLSIPRTKVELLREPSPTTTDNTSGTTSSTLSTNGNSSTSGTQSDETNSSSNPNPDSDSNPSVYVLSFNHSDNAPQQVIAPRPSSSSVPTAFLLCPPQECMEQMALHFDEIAGNVLSQRSSGNNPASSRFLPRPCQIICMNPQNPRESIYMMHPRRHQHLMQIQPRARSPQQPLAPNPCIDHVMGHPMFWSMLDPLNRDQSGRRYRHYRSPMPPITTQVTDRAMYSFGRAPNPVEPGVIWIRNVNRAQNNRLERIVLRNYTQITNLTLQHLVQCSPNLVYIDVSGTCITPAGIHSFQERMPDCEVVAGHLTNGSDESEAGLQSDRQDQLPNTNPHDNNGAAAVGAASSQTELAQEALEENDDRQQNVQLRSSMHQMVQHIDRPLRAVAPVQVLQSASDMVQEAIDSRESHHMVQLEHNNQERLQEDFEHPQPQPLAVEVVVPANQNSQLVNLNQALTNTDSSSSSSSSPSSLEKSKTV